MKLDAQQANEQLANGEITQERYDAPQVEIEATEQKLKSLKTQAATTNATSAKIEEVGATFTEVGDTISTVSTKLLAVTGVVTALGVAAVSTTSDFETAMSSVEALLSSSSENLTEDMEMLEGAARKAGETTKYSATEAAEAMSYMGLAGWDATEAEPVKKPCASRAFYARRRKGARKSR